MKQKINNPHIRIEDSKDKDIVSFIRKQSLLLGFDDCKITAADAVKGSAAALKKYLEYHYHASMEWIARNQEKRSNPKKLWPQANSAIMLAINYGPEQNPLKILGEKHCGAISVYARNRDYHDIIKGKLKIMASKLVAYTSCDVKVFVDTAPLMEKPLAARAGIGWQGKHTNLVSRQFGSWLFLGTILTTLNLPNDIPESNHCGTCQACIDICPTNAFPAPYQIDSRKCISYLTIEHKGPIDRNLRHAMGNRIYGCDDCLAVCPWNKFARNAHEIKLVARDDLKAPELVSLSRLDDKGFRTFFSGSPIKRIGRDRFIRNVVIAIGNFIPKKGDIINNDVMIKAAQRLAHDSSPLVRGAAVWALIQLLPKPEFAKIASQAIIHETNSQVLEEWSAGLACA